MSFASSVSALRLIGAALCLAMGATACVTHSKTNVGGAYLVSTPKTAFYKFGPSQSFGPDFQVEKGRRMTMLERAFGFSRVKLDDGTTGYLASDDIQPAPPEAPKPAVTASAEDYSWMKHKPDAPIAPGSAPMDTSDLPAPPLPENPEPKQ